MSIQQRMKSQEIYQYYAYINASYIFSKKN